MARDVYLNMKVLLLGGSGLLGHNVLQRLVDCGHKVVAVVRRSGAIRIEGVDYDQVVGRIDDTATVVSAAEGCDAIINCAGVTDMALLHREDYQAINCDLCASIVDAMKRHGIRRLVHASTANTIGYGTAGHPADENEPPKAPFSDSYYADSKRAGETLLIDAARRHADWHVIVVNPGYMLGPMDVKPSSGRMLLAAYRRRVMVAPSGGKAFVDVRDVAAAMVRALEKGISGERYIAVGTQGCFSIRELYRLQAETMGYRQKIITLPNFLMLAAGAIGDFVRWMGVRTELSTINVRQLMVCEYYSNSHAVNDLDMPSTPIAQSIRDFHAWRNNQKTIKTK